MHFMSIICAAARVRVVSAKFDYTRIQVRLGEGMGGTIERRMVDVGV